MNTHEMREKIHETKNLFLMLLLNKYYLVLLMGGEFFPLWLDRNF